MSQYRVTGQAKNNLAILMLSSGGNVIRTTLRSALHVEVSHHRTHTIEFDTKTDQDGGRQAICVH
jgi:hypothetical protein